MIINQIDIEKCPKGTEYIASAQYLILQKEVRAIFVLLLQ